MKKARDISAGKRFMQMLLCLLLLGQLIILNFFILEKFSGKFCSVLQSVW